jgi:TQXA domain-containing protein
MAMGTPASAAGTATGHAGGKPGGFHVMVTTSQGETIQVSTDEITLKIDQNEPVTAYCIDLGNPLTDKEPYKEASWQSSNVNSLANIQWIINNSFPQLKAPDVARAAGVDISSISAADVEHLVYAGTQTAIWGYSDGAKLANWDSKVNGLPSEAMYAKIAKVREYLTTGASGSKATEPPATLSIDPATKTAAIGGKAGPFTVHSGSAEVTLTATGGKIVDKDGKPVTKLGNGGTFWATSDNGGKVTVTAAATGEVPSGRVFVADKTNGQAHQKIILAGVAKTQLTATAEATFTAAPSASSSSSAGSLPVTGASVTTAIGTGLVLVLAGGALAMVAVRRRKVRFTA